jgi:two-component system OmpR family response regulator
VIEQTRWRPEVTRRPEVTVPPPTVMVVEDDRDFRQLIVSSLVRDAYHVIEFGDGNRAMDFIDKALDKAPSHWLPDLLITDVRLPGHDGLDLVAYSGFVPAIVMTAFCSDTVRDEAAMLGAWYVFDKPFNQEDLMAAVRHVLR